MRLAGPLLLLLLAAACPAQEPAARHIGYLCSDELGGRYPATVGDSLTRDYISDCFRDYRLQPFMPYPGYQQFFPILKGIRFTGAFQSLTRDSVHALQLNRDFAFYTRSPEANLSAEGCFIGYGIHDTLSAAHVLREEEIRGRMVFVYTRFLEDSDPEVLRWARSHKRGFYHDLVRLGAAAVVDVVPDSLFRPPASRKDLEPLGVPYLLVNHSSFLKIFGKERIVQAEGRMRSEKTSVFYYPPGNTLFLSCTREIDYHATANVLGVVPGRDSLFIVIGAHHDHLGEGDRGILYRGADDNASGTAVLLELARRLADSSFQHSLLFAAFGAEERGMAGSGFFLEHLPFSRDSILAMINLDMVGRMEDNILYFEEFFSPDSRNVHAMPDMPAGLSLQKKSLGVSDNYPFFRAGIHNLYFSTGLHPDQHTPGDVPGKLNIAGMERILEFISGLVSFMAR